MQIEDCEFQMDQARARLTAEYLGSDVYRKAVQDVRAAQARDAAARDKIRLALEKSPEYQRVLSAKKLADRDVYAQQAAYREGPTADAPTNPPETIPATIVNAAQAKLDTATHLSRMEASAIQQDSEARAAHEQLEAAGATLRALQTRFAASIYNDPQWLTAKRRLDMLRAGATP